MSLFPNKTIQLENTVNQQAAELTRLKSLLHECQEGLLNIETESARPHIEHWAILQPNLLLVLDKVKIKARALRFVLDGTFKKT